MIYTDPARVRVVLAYHDRHGRSATIRTGVSPQSLDRWLSRRDEHGPEWPTPDLDVQWQASRPRREWHAAEERRRRAARYLNGGQPLLADATGTRRRIRALMRLGWTTQHIADRGPWATGAAVGFFTKFPSITQTNAAHIRRIYDELSMKLGPSAQTRARAERAGWAPPLGWDDDLIDDPTAVPAEAYRPVRSQGTPADEVVVHRILNGEWRLPCSRADKVAVVAAWTGSLNELSRRTGWKSDRYTTREDGAA